MTTPDKYNNAIPQPNQTIADSQNDFLVNFSQLFAAFGIDHVALNDPTNPGNHNKATLFQQPLSLFTGISEVAFYSKDRKFQTTQLFFREQGNQQEFQYSNYQLFTIKDIFSGGAVRQTTAFSFLPGNIIVYFGRINPGSETFTLELNPVVCNNIAAVNFCPIGTNKFYPPTIGLTTNENGLFKELNLTNTNVNAANIPDCFYIIFGNPVI